MLVFYCKKFIFILYIKISLLYFFQLLTLRRLIGDNQFNQLMLTLHPEIDKELKLYVSL